jgi:hypothetical protein
MSAQNPSFTWAQQVGDTTGSLGVLSSATDAHGNLYTTGVLVGTVDMDPGPGIFNLTDSGFGDIYIMKIDSSGIFQWAKQIGKSSYDEGRSLAVDGNNNVYITGFFSMDSTDFDPGPGTFYFTNISGARTFILKLNSDGNFIWAKTLESIYENSARSLALDSASNIFLTGICGGTTDFDPGAGTDTLSTAITAIYILKLDSTGTFDFAKLIDAGTTNSTVYSIATDNTGNCYATGLLLGTVDFDPGPAVYNLTKNSSSLGGSEFIVKLDNTGNFAWAEAIQGSIDQSGGDRAIVTTANGDNFTTGWFMDSVDFDPSATTSHFLHCNFSTDPSVYLVKLDPNGNFVWANQLADPINDKTKRLATDPNGNVYVYGWLSPNQVGDFDPGSATYNLNGNDGNAFIAKYNFAGALVWAVNFSSDNNSSIGGKTIALDPVGNVYSTGAFFGLSDFDPGAGVYNLTCSSSNIFFEKMSQPTVTAISENSNQPQITLFPNPFSKTLHIDLPADVTFTVSVKDIAGREILFYKEVKSSLSISDFPTSGMYFITLENRASNFSKTVKVIRE